MPERAILRAGGSIPSPDQSKPANWLTRLIFFLTRRRFGTVIEPVKIHARSLSRLIGFSLMTALGARYRHISPRIALLAQLRVAVMVECDF